MTPTELKAEILTGPLAATLAASWASGEDNETARLLNDPAGGRSKAVPRTLSLTELSGLGGISPASVAAVFNHARFSDFRDVINKQDIPGAMAMASLFAATGIIQPADLTAFTSYATATVPKTCGRADELGWTVTVADVGTARREG